ncbi:MAG: Hsp20/alpha crystallin family protein [Ktedonobacteraceae bacterium]|nr:Hsp20/alpha crystallin family protein [Ktedonobacteraceae bacterium]
MAQLKRFDPLREALSLHEAMNQLFAQSFVQPGWSQVSSATLTAPVDVFETQQGYQVRVLLPGMKPEDIELTTQQNTLTVRGQFHASVQQDQQVNWLVQEIGSGAVERTVTLPKPIDSDKIETSYEQGVLSITLPVVEASRPKRIAVTGSQPRQLAAEAGKQ